jgi:hypothetical protein
VAHLAVLHVEPVKRLGQIVHDQIDRDVLRTPARGFQCAIQVKQLQLPRFVTRIDLHFLDRNQPPVRRHGAVDDPEYLLPDDANRPVFDARMERRMLPPGRRRPWEGMSTGKPCPVLETCSAGGGRPRGFRIGKIDDP